MTERLSVDVGIHFIVHKLTKNENFDYNNNNDNNNNDSNSSDPEGDEMRKDKAFSDRVKYFVVKVSFYGLLFSNKCHTIFR